MLPLWARGPIRLAVGFGFLLLLAVGGLLLLHRFGPGSGASRSLAAPGAAVLPDAPSAEEQGYLTAVAAHPRDPLPARQLGEFNLGIDRPFEALWAYSLALQASPGDSAATVGLAKALEAAQMPEEAAARLRAVLAQAPEQRDAAAALAELDLRTGQPEAALAVVKAAGSRFLLSRDGALLEGRIREALGDSDGAARAYRRAVGPNALDPGAAEAWHRLGLLALARGDLFNARQALGAARVLALRNPAYCVDFGRTFAASPKPEEWRRAPEFYVEAMNSSLQFAPAHYEAGLWYERQSRWAEAIQRFRSAVDADPGNANAHEQLARALAASGHRAEAHYQRGLAADARHLRAAALQQYEAAAADDSHDPDADLGVAQAHLRMDQLEPGRARLVKAHARYPHHTLIRERLIAFDLLAGDRTDARRLCQEWLKEEPGAPRALWMLSRAAQDEMHYPEAIRLDEQALAGDPKNPEFLGTLGETLLQTPGGREIPRAVTVLAHAATLALLGPRWRADLAQALQRAGRTADAKRQALRALDLDPHQTPVYNMVVQVARQERAPAPLTLFAHLLRVAETRDREERRLWQATWQHPEDPDAYEALARFLFKSGDPATAANQLAEAARLRPGSADTRAQWVLARRLRQVL